jgi:hypothetical protein
MKSLAIIKGTPVNKRIKMIILMEMITTLVSNTPFFENIP